MKNLHIYIWHIYQSINHHLLSWTIIKSILNLHILEVSHWGYRWLSDGRIQLGGIPGQWKPPVASGGLPMSRWSPKKRSQAQCSDAHSQWDHAQRHRWLLLRHAHEAWHQGPQATGAHLCWPWTCHGGNLSIALGNETFTVWESWTWPLKQLTYPIWQIFHGFVSLPEVIWLLDNHDGTHFIDLQIRSVRSYPRGKIPGIFEMSTGEGSKPV